jgi:hypothetical protein
MTGADAATTAGPTPAAGPQLWAQTHALRALADLLDRHGCDGLNLTAHYDQLSVLVPAASGPARWRTAAVARLAAALGTHPTHQPGQRATGTWVTADADLAGHRIHVHTRLDDTETTTP